MNNQILEKYFNETNLYLAWERVLRWSDRSAKDMFGIKSFRPNLKKNINTLSYKLTESIYEPSRPEKYYVPKSSFMQRTKSILLIEDAITYQAIVNIIGMNAYDKLHQNDHFVFGSVLSPEVKYGTDILKQKDDQETNLFFFQHYLGLYKKFADSINSAIIEEKVTFKFETDITGFFDSIPHYNLLDELSRNFEVEDTILVFLEKCFNMWAGTRERFTPGVGIPQGAQPSFFFANTLLHNLDNLLISDALKYYRYMDDIRIYGYSEEDMIKALIKIDHYLKGFGLALNAKKTTIQEVVNDETDDSIIRFLEYFKEDIGSTQSEFIDEFSNLAEQDSQSEKEGQTIILTNEGDIKNFWFDELKYVEKELPKLFIYDKENNTIELPKKVEDREILNLCFKYRLALKKLSILGHSKMPSDELLKYWMHILKNRFWRADQICWVLNYYKKNSVLKKELFNFVDNFIPYEWFRHQIFMCLNLSQKFTAQELHRLFQQLKNEQSHYSRWALYKLLLFHSKDEQLNTSIMRKITNETNFYMKKELLFYAKRIQNGTITDNELNEFFGT